MVEKKFKYKIRIYLLCAISNQAVILSNYMWKGT